MKNTLSVTYDPAVFDEAGLMKAVAGAGYGIASGIYVFLRGCTGFLFNNDSSALIDFKSVGGRFDKRIRACSD